jgi:hypothetical protein
LQKVSCGETHGQETVSGSLPSNLTEQMVSGNIGEDGEYCTNASAKAREQQ